VEQLSVGSDVQCRLMPTPASPALLHLVGYLTGATLYAMLLAMVSRPQSRGDRFALATAILGLTWNIGELLVHAALAAGFVATEPWLAAVAYSALGFLAAVVVHSVSRTRSGEQGLRQTLSGTVAVIAYGSALAAAALHLYAAATRAELPSARGLEIVTGGLFALGVPLVVATHRQDQARRALWMSALAVFAVSALHLGRFHGANESWAMELIGHHASIPLAFAMLYRDYRFALADLFLKNALTLLALVATVLVGYSALASELAPSGPVAVGLLLGMWIATAMLFPALRRAVNWFVDHVVLSRSNYSELVDDIAATIQERDEADSVLAYCSKRLGPALNAASVTFEKSDRTASAPAGSAAIIIPTAEAPHFVLRIGELAGGRRLLSDDLEMLQRVAEAIARRLDAIRLTDERYERMLREREIRSLATEAELRALRAQVNPHFLFNALTTIAYLIQTAPPRALNTLMQLTTLLRSVLRSEGEFTSLGRERELIECYLQIELERFEDRLTTFIDIPREIEEIPIPSLIVQPLVENAIKHGIAQASGGGIVEISARLSAFQPQELQIVVRNTGGPLVRVTSRDGGVGLQSVERRLQCYYGDSASLTLKNEEGGTTTAILRLPISDADDGSLDAMPRVIGA
jgi:two-component system LytT family sensor kinase